jgi:thiol:disulfide interchange protein DsbC
MRSMVISFLGFALSAVANAATDQEIIKLAQEKFKATFVNTGIQSFGPSPIEGLYQMKTQSGIIYYYPDKELLVFGKIYNKEGVDLTTEVVNKSNKELIANLPLDSALVLGDPEASTSFIEITNPDCGYCQKFSHWVDKQENKDVKRLVFFYTYTEQAAKKAIHILCHPEDYTKVFNREPVNLTTCPEGEATYKRHSAAMKELAPTGTPSFIVAGQPFVGFDERIFTNLYRKSNVEK